MSPRRCGCATWSRGCVFRGRRGGGSARRDRRRVAAGAARNHHGAALAGHQRGTAAHAPKPTRAAIRLRRYICGTGRPGFLRGGASGGRVPAAGEARAVAGDAALLRVRLGGARSDQRCCGAKRLLGVVGARPRSAATVALLFGAPVPHRLPEYAQLTAAVAVCAADACAAGEPALWYRSLFTSADAGAAHLYCGQAPVRFARRGSLGAA
eukprot:ctg_224.g155